MCATGETTVPRDNNLKLLFFSMRQCIVQFILVLPRLFLCSTIFSNFFLANETNRKVSMDFETKFLKLFSYQTQLNFNIDKYESFGDFFLNLIASN